MTGLSPMTWMAGTCLASWFALTMVAGDRLHPEVLYGMLAPLVSASATWIAASRAYRSSPDRLMQVLMTGFAVKMVLFAAYLSLALRVLDLRPVPFVAALVGYLIALYAMEAFFLQRLITAGIPPSGRAETISPH